MLVKFGKMENNELLSLEEVLINSFPISAVVLETTTFYGGKVGIETMDTCVWIGRFVERAEKCDATVARLSRREIKKRVCGKSTVGDKEVRAALIQRFAKFDKVNGRGKKKNPDVFYGVANDAWSAIAVAVAYIDLERDKEFARLDAENDSGGA